MCTPNKICLIEAGMPPLKVLVLQKQSTFINKIINERSDLEDDPLIFALNLTEKLNPKMRKCINDLKYRLNCPDVNIVKRYVANATTTRYTTYANINSDMSMHNVYARRYDRNSFIPEVYRIAFTRMRTSSHRLRIETGRWSRLGREDRICKCGMGVGDEFHAMMQCPLTEDLRKSYGPVFFPELLANASTFKDFKYIHDVLELCE